ncbi:quinon protein alcohol dehydrogenase-like superfamily [Panaeolus papilionaceus]|nr:quinon protein alcohol dehydrogenase-like superfamily [Panaeolus papilionaceus]
MSSNVLHQSSSYTFADHSTEQEVDFEGISNLCFNYYQLKTSIELAYRLLSSLPRARLASIQRRIAPLLQFDVVASLPPEVSLQIFSYLPFQTLLTCTLVCRRWQILANDQALWRALCHERGWKWKQPPRSIMRPSLSRFELMDADDEGMGDSDEGDSDLEHETPDELPDDIESAKARLTQMQIQLDSELHGNPFFTNVLRIYSTNSLFPGMSAYKTRVHTSVSSYLKRVHCHYFPKPDYKLLHQTHVKLRNRFLASAYRLSALQTRGTPADGHTNTIYCLQLYTYPFTGKQVLFTGSRDKTVREWNLATGAVERVISGVHTGSILSLCAHAGYLATAGSDRRVVVWDLESNTMVKTISDHDDSVLCVRFDDKKLVSCSKGKFTYPVQGFKRNPNTTYTDRTVRLYSFPDLDAGHVLRAHRAAVNAVAISGDFIASASGDRSIRLWDANTGNLVRTFDKHHSRGIASIDFALPVVLSGSSDKHIRLFDVTTLQGWSTSPEYDDFSEIPSDVLPLSLPSSNSASSFVCQSCGSTNVDPLPVPQHIKRPNMRCVHTDLVRTVALDDDFVLSGSYDLSIKVWDRKTGSLIADLTGGHTGRILCIGFDSKKIVSCGEDQRICIWDFSHGIDTTFMA